jgi:hypothetical protein
MEARMGTINAVGFPPYLNAYKTLMDLPNVRLFVRQAEAFHVFAKSSGLEHRLASDAQISVALGQCMAMIAYGQLIAENATHLGVPPEMVSTIFRLLVADMSEIAIRLASVPDLEAPMRALIRRMICIPKTGDSPGVEADE